MPGLLSETPTASSPAVLILSWLGDTRLLLWGYAGSLASFCLSLSRLMASCDDQIRILLLVANGVCSVLALEKRREGGAEHKGSVNALVAGQKASGVFGLCPGALRRDENRGIVLLPPVIPRSRPSLSY